MKINNNSLKISDFDDVSLLVVDDDDPFRNRLGRAMESTVFSTKMQKLLLELLLTHVEKPLLDLAITINHYM